MQDYTIPHKSIIDKIGISKIGIFMTAVVFLFPFLFLTYLNQIELAISITLFFVFLIILNVNINILPSFLKIKYKLKITNDGIAFYLFAPSHGYRFPSFRRHHIQFSSIKNYVIKNDCLILHYQKNHGFYNMIEKRKIKNLSPENLSEISNILSQKIGDKFNAGFNQPIFAWLWQNFHLTIILAMVATVVIAIISKTIKNFF